MTSPDFREYVDLTINDLQPDEIYDLAKEYAILALPEFDPRTGTVEDALLQAVAYVSGLVTGAINRLPNGLIEGLMKLLGFNRREATFATGKVQFSVIDDAGITIPSGTQLAYNEVRDNTTIVHLFETILPVTVDVGDSVSPEIGIVALEAGVKPVIADGEYLTILTPIGRLFDAEFQGSLVQGADSESDNSFFDRAATYFLSLSSSLATATQTTSYVLTNYPDAYRTQAYDLRKLPVFKPSIIGHDGTSGFLSIYPRFNQINKYPVLELDTDVTDIFYSEKTLAASAVPVADNASVIRIFDSTEPDYDGIFAVTTGSNTSDVTRFTFPVTGTERKIFCFVRAATTVNIASLSGVAAIDDVSLVAGDLVLVKNQNTASQNGVYVASASSWTRITEISDSDTLDGPIYVYVEEGTSNGGETWRTTNTGALVIGTTALSFSQDTVFSFLPKVEILDTIATEADDALGAITIFLSDSTGASLTAEQKAIVANDVSSKSIAGLSVYVTDAIIAEIAVSVSIGVIDGYSEIEVKSAVSNYITAALSPASFPFAPLIRKNALIASISRIAGVDYVNDLQFAVEPGSEAIAAIDPVSLDLVFNYVGVVPSTTASVAAI